MLHRLLPERVRARLPKSRFVRRLAMLSSGTLAGQAMLIASAPLLTRIYTPADLGVLAVFSAITAVTGVIMTLRYEFAIPVCATDDEAAAVTAVGLVASLVLSLLLAAAIAAFGPFLAVQLALGSTPGLLWLLPPLMLVWGFGLALSHWSIRRGTFKANAVGNFVQYAGQAVLQVAFGLSGLGVTGLVLGYTLGLAGRGLLFVAAVSADDRRLLAAARWPAMRAAAARHWRYPVFSGTSSLLQSASQMLPAVAVAVLYGPAVAGLFGLGQRIIGLPVRMLAEAASYAFLGEAARAEGQQLYRLFLITTLRFFLLGSALMAPVLLAGPQLFALAFGEEWREAGLLTQLLVPLYLARFVTVPVSQTLNIHGRQHLHLTASALNLAAFASSFFAGWALALDAATTILAYSLASTAAFAFYLAAAWRTARHVAAAPAAARPMQGPPDDPGGP